jgi:hypothetical protein
MGAAETLNSEPECTLAVEQREKRKHINTQRGRGNIEGDLLWRLRRCRGEGSANTGSCNRTRCEDRLEHDQLQETTEPMKGKQARERDRDTSMIGKFKGDGHGRGGKVRRGGHRSCTWVVCREVRTAKSDQCFQCEISMHTVSRDS